MRVGAVHKSSSRRRWLRQILIFGVGAGVVLTLGLGVWTMIPQPHSAPGQHHEFCGSGVDRRRRKPDNDHCNHAEQRRLPPLSIERCNGRQK